MPANDSDRVKAGELITAEFMNDLLTRIDEIESKLDDLEAPNKNLEIKSLQSSGAIRVGKQLSILGKDFGPLSETVVTVGDERVETFSPGSNESRINFDVPQIQSLVGESSGKQFTLTVSGRHGFDSRSVTIHPFEPSVPQGNIAIRLAQRPDVDKIQMGKNYTFTFEIGVRSNMQETFNVQAGIDADAQQSAWSATAVDATGNPLSTVTLPESEVRTKRSIPVEVTVPAGTEGTKARITLTVSSQLNPSGFSKTLDSTEIKVGAAPPESEAIAIQRRDVIQGTLADDGETVISPALVGYSASVPENGVDYVIEIQNPSMGWNPQFENGETSKSLEGNNGEISFEIGIPDPEPGASEGDFDIRAEKDSDDSVFGTFTQPITQT